MKRLFAALKIHPDAEFLEKYHELRRELRHEQIKWVEESNIHITLKFFGETEEQKIQEICAVLATRSSVTLPVLIHLNGLGIFGSSYAPKVIWVGIEPYAEISLLMTNVHSDLKSVGFDPDRQNPVPHLTLGRIKFLRDKIIFDRTIKLFKTIVSSPVLIGQMVLYESILRREGPEYIALHKFPFIK